ncbi:MAG: bifunctional phosphoribosylaminoimidazolecarboxamide formyltransferase/IMP cyclohydrolase, partial [Candidatus Caldarchaeum sp.]
TDKTGIVEFAKGLQSRGFEILSTGGTASLLKENGVDVTNVSYYTGMPEILGGRVKTLHPKIQGGLLAQPSDLKHRQELEELNIRRIDVLAVNLYRFEDAVRQGLAPQEVLENIDIGGPAMIRAGAKNAEHVFVVVDPNDYEEVLNNVDAPAPELRTRLQAKAFAYTAFYDSLISHYLWEQNFGEELPPSYTNLLAWGLRLRQKLRYGENPHQKGALYLLPLQKSGVASAQQIWGKELSYNNLLDAESAWECAGELYHLFQKEKRPCVIVKHGNPCGAAWSSDPTISFNLAKEGDPVSAFGGIVAIPGELDADTALALTSRGNFFEVIIASKITDSALKVFQERSGWGQDVRLLEAGEPPKGTHVQIRGLRGAVLVQTSDFISEVDFRCVTTRQPRPEDIPTMRALWVCVKYVKSNAIVVGSGEAVWGVGAGQMNRVQSVRLALTQAGEKAKGSILASDAFFPFPDSIEEAAQAGVSIVVQPGGSKNDEAIIHAAESAGIAMLLTGFRHFRH